MSAELDILKEAPPPVPQAPPETQWSIVARMFRKRATAVWGLRGAIVLVYIAVYAPVITSGIPLVWRAPGGDLEFPWLRRLFDLNYWTNSIDRIFNLLMVALTIWLLLRLVFWIIGLIASDTRQALAAVRGKMAKGFACLVVLLVVAQALGAPLLLGSEPYVDYRADARKYQKAYDEAPAETKQALGHTALFTFVPYGHREQLERREDQFRGIMHFEGGERHILGTDKVGRDIFARIIYGSRISLTVGLIAVAIYVTIGVIIGAIAGYSGGKIDLLIMRVIEIVMCVPGLFLILTIIALFGSRSIFMIMLAIGIVSWTGIARLVRGEIIRERGRDYVSAARSLGLSNARILFRHVLPNAVAPVIVSATFGVAGAIITESTLSFLGLGDVSVPSWGMVLNDGRQEVQWHMILVPGVAIFIAVTLLNLVGDGLRDALDPKLRK